MYTGEICVSFDTIPTNSSYLADSSLVTGDGTISFTALTGKIISFKPKDESGNGFEYVDHASVFLDPYNRRYLISDADNSLYTVEQNALVNLRKQNSQQHFLKHVVYRISQTENFSLRCMIRPSFTGMIPRISSQT